MKNNPNLHEWLHSAIKQREYLLRSGKSKGNNLAKASNTEFLKKQLEAYPYTTKESLQGFINRHKMRIYDILPGEGSASCEKKRREFIQILNEINQ